jgi:ribonucleoside-diphosphate reductase alpha chain
MLKIVNQTVPVALHALGYDAAAIAQILKHIERYDTIEDVGNPGGIVKSGLNAADLAVFDCAFKPQQGVRSLHYSGHIKMMAACQPFLSGAISKTVNLPEAAMVDDIVATYMEGWKLGLKAIAIYRDGSKRSAPLNVKKTKDMGGEDSGAAAAIAAATAENPDNRVAELLVEITELKKTQGQPVRTRMPETRAAINHKFDIGGHEGYLNVGLFENGQPGEIFISMSKEGSTIGGLMDTIATITSIALQYGVPLESLVRKFAYQRFEPSGFTSNPAIRHATSIADYVFRWLGCKFIAGYKEATAPRSVETYVAQKPEPEKSMPTTKAQIAIGHAFMDVICTNCGSSKVIRAGACGCCTECGTSQGCS